MKDLKHINYFEKLLEAADNELIREAINDGGVALGYTCYHVPEPIMNMGKGFSVRLRAPLTGSTSIASYYLSNFVCSYCRGILERAIEGGYNFLGGFLASETCSHMNRCSEHFEMLNLVENDKFFIDWLDVPKKISDFRIKKMTEQLKEKFLKPMSKNYNIDVSKEALIQSVKEHNEINDILRQISEFRKEDKPKITGTEFHTINLVAKVCPKHLIKNYLIETLEEIKHRIPDDKKYRARVVVVGSEIDNPEFIKLIEDQGALVVADRFCYGAYPEIEPIKLTTDDPFEDVVRHYIETCQCPRMMDGVKRREAYTLKLVNDFNADGIIYETMKFCDYWGYEKSTASHDMINKHNIPAVTIEREYTMSSAGQLRTRVQAFVESLEIKEIQKKGKVK
ncbi:2-hydroxyacyl-CoA dehydratase family protein [Tepidibacter sp. Z1-5]|uniref:2-hydroxyacyl-CoA dehydratase family protein n=1 Tax=Tepidibacter sp. Z1-5 TaxID=3134138 RepID=UPI0030C4430D